VYFKQNKAVKPNENPFVKDAEGRKEWNDRFLNMKTTIKHWQLAFFAAIASVAILSFVVMKVASESKVQPFVVETNNGIPVAIKPVTALSAKDQMLINYAVNQFIINARTIISDNEAEKAILNKVYAYSADNTISYLHDYYQKNNPFDQSSQFNVSVNIFNSLPISKDTWQVTWDETKRSISSGVVISTTRWMANVTYKFAEVNTKYINDNPFGLYITQVSWSQSQVQ
jgi:type IV secretory pathway TrbF-like protein